MKNVITALMFAGLVSFGMQAMADDTAANDAAGSTSQAHKQFMKDCMKKAKAANNGTSEDDMKKACRAQMKAAAGEPNEPVVPAH